MNKKLESIIDRVPTWPKEAQDEAVRALAAIEEKHIGIRRPPTPEEQAKLAALRETINQSIERSGSYTDEEVEASISARLDAWERERNGARLPLSRAMYSAMESRLSFAAALKRRRATTRSPSDSRANSATSDAIWRVRPSEMGRSRAELRPDLRAS